MLEIVNLTMSYGKRVLFENVNFKLDAGKRYGLIGANGAGKSTLLKILQGDIDATNGEVRIANGLKLGALGQNQFAFEDFSLKDAVLFGNKRLYDANKEKESIYAKGEFNDADNDRLGVLEMICLEEDPTYECEIKIEKILTDLGFDDEMQETHMSNCNNADKFKILLAQVLFLKPDILLLDEPTNNLDLKTISWLEEHLKRHEGTLIVISHDRHFLNAVVTHILDLDYQNIREFTGNYDEWYLAANVIAKRQEMERNKTLKEKAELESFIRRFSANASKAKQATSRQKKLEKLDLQEIKLSSRRDPIIQFKPIRKAGREILSLKNISHNFDDLQIFKNLNLIINKEDKIALIGSNGVGKSTLCQIITEKLHPSSGTVNWGTTIKRSYFPQNTTDLINGDMKLYEWLKSFDKDADMDSIRNCLGRMLFNGEAQEKSIKGISGGEKHRMMMSKMMLESPNFLIFDEPDNHLDLEAIVALGEALYSFDGNIICASHDRELLDAFANRIIEIKDNGKIVDFKGSYEEYRETFSQLK